MRYSKILKALVSFILCIVFVSGVFVPVKAADPNTQYRIVYNDEAGLIKGDNEAILEAMEALAECGNVGFITTNDKAKSGTDYFRQEYYEQFGNESGAIFFIDMYDRNLYIWTDGALGKKLTVGACNTITDDIYKYAADGDYAKTAERAFELMYRKAASLSIPQPMKYTCNALVAAFAALLTVYLIVRGNNKHKIPSSEEWLDNINYSCNLDGVNARMTQHIVHKSSGGSGGYHGGGHGGGHSHGGGGHRGGGHGGGHHF